jgi:hypothetical protein
MEGVCFYDLIYRRIIPHLRIRNLSRRVLRLLHRAQIELEREVVQLVGLLELRFVRSFGRR